MPLPIVLIIAAIAITLLAAILHRLGYSKEAQLTDANQAQSLFEKENPGIMVDKTLLSRDGHTALLTLREQTQALGLIQSIGDEFLTRVLSAGQIAAAVQGPNQTLTLNFTDFTYPRAHLQLARSSDAMIWHQRAAQLIANAETPQMTHL